MKNFNQEIIGAKEIKETEKAILLNVEIDTPCGRSDVDVWFPKSQLEVDGDTFRTTEWMLSKKNEDISENRMSYGILVA